VWQCLIKFIEELGFDLCQGGPYDLVVRYVVRYVKTYTHMPLRSCLLRKASVRVFFSFFMAINMLTDRVVLIYVYVCISICVCTHTSRFVLSRIWSERRAGINISTNEKSTEFKAQHQDSSSSTRMCTLHTFLCNRRGV
jgi:hypothetical protein